jgi:hypothetical protein
MRRRTVLLAARAALSGVLSVFLLATAWGASPLSRLQIIGDSATLQLALITAPGWVFGTIVLAPEVGAVRGRALRRGLLIGLSALTFLVAFQIVGYAGDREMGASIAFALPGLLGALVLAGMVRLIAARRLFLWQWVAAAGFAATFHLVVFPLSGGATLMAIYGYTIGWQLGVAILLLGPVPRRRREEGGPMTPFGEADSESGP